MTPEAQEKDHHRRVTPARVRRVGAARQKLRKFAAFVETQDAELLASAVTEIASTLASVAKIDLFFRRYAAALRQRRPQ
jgi:hypothetical protein